MCLSFSMPQARPASTHEQGRRRLPPPPMMCSATWSTSGTVLLSRARIMRVHGGEVGAHQGANLLERHGGGVAEVGDAQEWAAA